MDRQVRRLGIAFVSLFAVLFAQVAYVQVVAADRIANQPANAARQIRAEYAVERGQILAADRRTVLAKSIPNEDPESPYHFVCTRSTDTEQSICRRWSGNQEDIVLHHQDCCDDGQLCL